MKSEDPEDPDAVLDAAGRALFELGRAFARLSRRDLFGQDSGPDAELGAILLAQAVADTHAARQDPTVGALAARLAVDPSTASRIVARSVRRGHLHRVVSQTDGRAVALHLTPAGEALTTGAARYQRAVFDTATHGWSAADRQSFARRFVDFAAAVAALTTAPTGATPDPIANPQEEL